MSKCLVCDAKAKTKGLCQRHYRQRLYEGGPRRTKYDPNTFTIEDGICKIMTYTTDGRPNHVGIVDASDFALVSRYKWHSLVTKRGTVYLSTKIDRKEVGLHSMLLGTVGTGKHVDHANRNGLDNRRLNIRVCNEAENQWNAEKMNGSFSSQFKGVSFSKKLGKWKAGIRHFGVGIHLGYFEKETDAAIAYNSAALKYHGEFARLNRIGV